MENISKYKVTDSDAELLAGFHLVAGNVDLETVDVDASTFTALQGVHGVYFWLMRHAGGIYKLYAGKTNSLPRRVREYRNKFQPGVPNDFKMRHFQAWAREKFRGAELDLYFFKASDAKDAQAKETSVLRASRPFINQRVEACPNALQSAHWEYYKNRFENALAEDAGSDAETVISIVTTTSRVVDRARSKSWAEKAERSREGYAKNRSFREGSKSLSGNIKPDCIAFSP